MPNDKQVFLLALYFHDLVYDATSSSNEEDSQALFEKFSEEAALESSVKSAVS